MCNGENLNQTLKNRQDFKIWTWLGDSMSGRENPRLVVWNNRIFFLFQVQVLKLLLNLSENPAMTDRLLDAQVSTCIFVLSIYQFGQTDPEGKDLSQSINRNSPWGDMEGNTPFHKPMLFIHSFIHSFSQSFTLYILSHCFGNLLKQRAWWCCKPKNWAHFFVDVKIKDTTKSKIRRRKGLFLAASKENSRELSQSSVSLNSKIGVHGVHFKLRVHAYT